MKLSIPLVLLLSVAPLAAADAEGSPLGRISDRLIVANHVLILEPELTGAIDGIGLRLAAAADIPLPQYTFRVLSHPRVDVMAVDGGFVYVTTGFLDMCESRDMLAAALAHALAHTNRSHQLVYVQAERRKAAIANVVSGLLSLSISFAAGYVAARIPDQGFGYGRAGNLAFPTPYGNSIASSFAARMAADLGPRLAGEVCDGIVAAGMRGLGKKLELEADALALGYLRRAGYDPRVMLSLFDKLGSQKNYGESSLIDAEPGLPARAQQIRLLLAKEGGK